MARKIWSEAEETLLLWALTSMVQSTMWNAEDGIFRPDYLNYLQGLMAVEFPIEEYHIEAKIKRWKQTYWVILNLINVPGFHWDPTQHRVVAEDDVWEAHIQVSLNFMLNFFPNLFTILKGEFALSFMTGQIWLRLLGGSYLIHETHDRTNGKRDESTGTHPMTAKFEFIQSVREAFGSDSKEYTKFVQLMRDFRDKRILFLKFCMFWPFWVIKQLYVTKKPRYCNEEHLAAKNGIQGGLNTLNLWSDEDALHFDAELLKKEP
ncbi:hypothetical protein RHSIM_Rhsim08G0166600 [Rhododendron simsii]|uniref:Myb/SANT-like domain-containing protein n=1 Tax=Rhododendron simsii TaxID=118357 RepID=A0A834LDB7_RHOSS|nr:hypothetical protein RHSIM_Rhsim08G0166600 [Rhododendron simsii]